MAYHLPLLDGFGYSLKNCISLRLELELEVKSMSDADLHLGRSITFDKMLILKKSVSQ